jgi:hypothetical protein
MGTRPRGDAPRRSANVTACRLGAVFEVDGEIAWHADAVAGDHGKARVLDVDDQAGAGARARIFGQPLQRPARAFLEVVAGQEELGQAQAGFRQGGAATGERRAGGHGRRPGQALSSAAGGRLLGAAAAPG